MEEFVVAYFQNIAVKLKELSHTQNDPSFHFIRNMIDMGSVTSTIASFKEGPIMLLENHEGGLVSNSDNDFEMISGAFTILIRATNEDEDNQLNELYARVNAIAMKIFSKMRYDNHNGDLDHFTFELQYQKVGPVSDNRYGRRYEFSIGRSSEFAFDENDWIV